MKKVQNTKRLQEISSIFGSDGATQNDIADAGMTICLMLWWEFWRFSGRFALSQIHEHHSNKYDKP